MSDTTDTKTNAYFTDALLRHLDTCNECITAKLTPGMPKCPQGRYLIKQTMIERHGGTA